MLVLLTNTKPLHESARRLFVVDPIGRAGVAEALRCELSARGVAGGRRLCERVQMLLQPLGPPDLALVRDVLDELANQGDATAGPRGMVAASPLRVVQVTEGQFATYGTCPTWQLRQELPGVELMPGLTRRIQITPAKSRAVAEGVTRLGGLVLSAQRWTGLDRVPAAGLEWIEELKYRLQEAPSASGSLDEGLAAPWQVYWPEAGREQWQRWRTARDNDTSASLWRARDEFGWWRHAWTGGGRPSTNPFVRLSRDEACRTSFSLDCLVSKNLELTFYRGNEVVELEADTFFPLAEYRYLVTLGERAETSGATRYRVPTGLWGQVEATLRERLGVTFTEGTGP
jgi:hypothetical protein